MGFLVSTQLANQLVFAFLQSRSERAHVHFRLPAGGEQLAFLLLHVVPDVLPEHLQASVIERLRGLRGADRGNQLLDRTMLDLRLVQEI